MEESEVCLSKRKTKSERFSAGMFSVEGRLFSSRADALAYCKAERISALRLLPCSPPKVDMDVLKLSVREDWTLRVLFHGDASLMVFEHAATAHAFCVPLSALVDLVSTVKARVRELARAGELL